MNTIVFCHGCGEPLEGDCPPSVIAWHRRCQVAHATGQTEERAAVRVLIETECNRWSRKECDVAIGALNRVADILDKKVSKQ